MHSTNSVSQYDWVKKNHNRMHFKYITWKQQIKTLLNKAIKIATVSHVDWYQT